MDIKVDDEGAFVINFTALFFLGAAWERKIKGSDAGFEYVEADNHFDLQDPQHQFFFAMGHLAIGDCEQAEQWIDDLQSSAPDLARRLPVAPVAAAPVVPTPAPVAPAVSPELVLQQAIEALSYQRRALYDRCFRPAVAARPGLTMDLVVNVTFDAQGMQLARGTVELAGSSTPELTACISSHMAPLRVPAPGVPRLVEVPLKFP